MNENVYYRNVIEGTLNVTVLCRRDNEGVLNENVYYRNVTEGIFNEIAIYRRDNEGILNVIAINRRVIAKSVRFTYNLIKKFDSRKLNIGSIYTITCLLFTQSL